MRCPAQTRPRNRFQFRFQQLSYNAREGTRIRIRTGIDSYAYHRLLGEIRPGEEDPGWRFSRGSLDAVAEARTLGVDAIMLETCFLAEPREVDTSALRDAAGPLEVGLSWGAPDGLAMGTDPPRLDDLLAWIPVARALGGSAMRIVGGSPRLRDLPIQPLVSPLRQACDTARSAGIRLALENHGDLDAGQLSWLLDAVGNETLAVCLDTANFLRVGDDPVHAARQLAPHVALVHLKDCEGTWADPVAGPVSVAPGTGVVELDAIVEACAGALICVELGQLAGGTDERALVAEYVAWLKLDKSCH